MIAKHFRGKIIDQLFHLFFKKTKKLSRQLELDLKEGTQLYVLLKHK